MTVTDEQSLLARIALPSSLGLAFGEQIWGEPWAFDPWLQYLEERIVEAILDTTRKRYLIVNAPPQVGKTSYVGELVPFWFSGHFPNKNVMYISYSDDFSHARGSNVMDYHKQFGGQSFGLRVNPRHASKGEWRFAGHRGGMLSVGIGGLITGKPGHLIVIDDLIKNEQDATSAAAKDLHEAEWDKTIKTRMQPGGTVIVMATRWADDDLTGRLKARMALPDYNGPAWEIIEFPAFAQPDEDVDLTPDEQAAWTDIIGRLEGEALTCRFSTEPGQPADEWFTEIRNDAMSGGDVNGWYCLYQQRPAQASESMFPPANWRYFKQEDCPDQFDKRVRVWDLAATENGGDWTVGTLMGKRGERYWVLDVRRFRKASGGVHDEIVRVAALDGGSVSILIEQEKGGAGPTAIEAYQRELVGYIVNPAKAEGDKTWRANPWSSIQNRHLALIPEPGSVDWDVKAYVKEHSRMMSDGRKPRNDDQVDTSAYALMDLLGYGGVEIVTQTDLPVPDSFIDELMEGLFA